MNTAAAKMIREISVEDFIRQLGFASGKDNVLGACYYAEFLAKQTDFGTIEIQALLSAAKLPNVSNLPRDLKSLASKKYLNVVKGTSNGRTRYSLTTVGADVINEQMKAVGLTISKPVERTEILKELAETLQRLIQTIPAKDEREYIEEAVSCLSPVNNAERAAVIMGWSGTVYNLRRKIDKQGIAGYAAFTSHLKKINPKKSASSFNDLEDVKDTDLLDICEKMDLIKGKSVKDQLAQWLTFRNGVGHPTNVKPGIYKVKAFFEDIIQYVMAQP
jgi:hypothetical protein